MTDKNRTARKSCYAVMGSLTNAQKAQKALAAAAIPTSVNKIISSDTHKGCIWSIQFSCNQLPNVQSVLSAARISVRAWGETDK